VEDYLIRKEDKKNYPVISGQSRVVSPENPFSKKKRKAVR